MDEPMKIEIKGLSELVAKLAKRSARTIRWAITTALFDIRSDALHAEREKFREPKTGEEYRKTPFNTNYRASAPGEAPAIKSGDLDRSLDLSEVDVSRLSLTISAGAPGVPYARALEEGTPKVAARPFFFGTAAERKDEWFRIIQKDFEEATR